MTKREFLEELKEALSEQLPQNQVAEHVSYYMNYIEERKRSGSSEDEVLDMLGDPRLIARTILDTTPGSKDNQNYFYEQTMQDAQSEVEKKGLSNKARKVSLYRNCYCSYISDYFTYYNFVIFFTAYFIACNIDICCDFYYTKAVKIKRKSLIRGAMRDFEGSINN